MNIVNAKIPIPKLNIEIFVKIIFEDNSIQIEPVIPDSLDVSEEEFLEMCDEVIYEIFERK